MEPRIRTLTIERFRTFRYLKIEGLGRVNLITGRNNTGKSSVLEAIRLLSIDPSASVIKSIVRSREEDFGAVDESIPPVDAEGLFALSGLFHGFPKFSAKIDPIVIASNGGGKPLAFTLRTGRLSEQYSRGVSLVRDEAVVVEVAVGEEKTPTFYDPSLTSRTGVADFLKEPAFRCVFVGPYEGERTGSLGTLWDRTALSGRENDAVEALRIIDSRISGVSMVGGTRTHRRVAVLRAEGFPRPLPLRSFGDGMNRLFGIALSLVNAKDGLLLIDEFENGMHHTIQTDVWRAIFNLAKSLNVQVFATCHSWDAIEAFQKAASEDPESEGVLVRLTRRGEDIIPTLFREDELAIITRNRIEVR